MTIIATLVVAILTSTVACAPYAATAPEAKATGDVPAVAPPPTSSCLDAKPPSPRPTGAAAHVYDTAVHSYLRCHATGIGRKLQGDENRNALAVTDDAIYHHCVQGKENCLREQLAQASNNAETLGLLTTMGAYAHDRALTCLIREGENATKVPAAPRPTTDGSPST